MLRNLLFFMYLSKKRSEQHLKDPFDRRSLIFQFGTFYFKTLND